MSRRRKNHPKVGGIYGFAATWFLLSLILPQYRLSGLLFTIIICSLVAFIVCRISGKAGNEKTAAPVQQPQKQAPAAAAPVKKSYGPEVDAILEEGNRALSEMGRIYMSVKDAEVRKKINEIMRITDKITQDAIADPSDVPQIKKFMNYYLPTTIKLLNTYDRMSAQGIGGENIDKSMKSIIEMLDAAIDAYKKQLDSLFANQALDVETDIEVMNRMLAREGLSGEKDFQVREG